MRQRIARRIGWVAILFAFVWLCAAYMQGGMGRALTAYSPTVSTYTQAGGKTPGEDGRNDNRNAASRGGMTPAQPRDLMQEEEVLTTSTHPMLPSQRLAARHAVHCLIIMRPLSELASRTGGHAPPL